MKKKFKSNFFAGRSKCMKVCLIMRLTLVLLAASLMQVYATGYTQSAKISLTLKNVSLKQALKEIEKQSDYTFVYSDSKIDVNKKIDINVKDCALVEVLDQLIADSEIRYTSIDNHIVLTGKKSYIYRLPAITHESILNREAMDMESINPIRNVLLQQVSVSGQVSSSADGQPLPGVNVVVKGTTFGTTTDVNGSFTLNVPDPNATLVFSFVGFQSQEIALAGQKSINITLVEETQELQEIVVVGYGTQKKKDITGSVSVVDAEALAAQPASNLGKQLAGRASGVTVSTSGDPSAGTSIRIRGVGSVNDNGPLIVIDGVSTRDQNLNTLNPNDVESVQILKDASASSIYGAQASSGVVIITTKKGSKDKTSISYNGYYGVQKSIKWYDLLDANGYMNMWATAAKNTAILRNWGQGIAIDRSYSDLFNDNALWNTSDDKNPWYTNHTQFGNAGNPKMPAYIVGAKDKNGNLLPWSTSNRLTRSGNTDWYKEISQVAPMQSHQLTASGGGEKGVYSLGLNYYDQEGVLKYTYLNRYSIRANSEFTVKKYIKIGENFTFSREQHHSDGNQEEGWGLSQAYRLVPWIPVYDENGEFAGSGAKEAGNGQNAYAYMYRRKDDVDINLRTFGNIYAEVNFLKDFVFKTSFGIDYKNGSGYALTLPKPEHSEATYDKAFREFSSWNLRWVFSNTLTWNKVFNDIHRFNVLVGTEAIRDGLGRYLEGQRSGYLFIEDKNTWTLGNGSTSGQTNNSYFWGDYSLFGVLGRLDYSLKDKYLLTAIVRRDGVSRFSENNRYGTFPAVSLGWRLSQENFMKGLTFIDDLKLRVGYGITGNAEIPNAYNYAYTYGVNANQFNYDITGSNNSSAVGMRMTKYGNVDTKWEQSRSTNIGIDGTMFNQALSFTIDGYVKNTSDMLVRDAYGSGAGQVDPPYVNIGEMKNTGIDFSLTHRGNFGADFHYDVTANISHYKNEVITVNGNPDTKLFGEKPRFDAFTILTEGQPISAFYGYKIEGIYKSKEDLANHATQPNINNKPGDLASNAWRASLGKFKFQDTNGDGNVDGNDKTIIGNPHPDFTYGVDLNLMYKSFDLNMFFVGSQGNDIFNYVKYWTDFNGSFVGNKSTYMVENSWNPATDAGKDTQLPVLVLNDNEGANNPTSYYVENGSYFRLSNMQIGYSLPTSLLGKFGIDRVRVYLQGTNLFTITKYSGLEPDLGTKRFGGTGTSSSSAVSENGEWNRGVDYGAYPQPRTYMAGISINF